VTSAAGESFDVLLDLVYLAIVRTSVIRTIVTDVLKPIEA